MTLQITNYQHRGGFSLMELLVAVVVMAILAGVGLPVYQHSREASKQVQCIARTRALGQGVLFYAQDNGGQFPRTLHTSGVYRQRNWVFTLLPYVGISTDGLRSVPEAEFNRLYRCPAHDEKDAQVYSYGLNVHFELDPKVDGASYAGAPAIWRRVHQVPTPTRTVLMAEMGDKADHFMSHFWDNLAAAQHAVSHKRHGGTSGYLFVDGHVEMLPVEKTFDPANGVNLWNPSLAK